MLYISDSVKFILKDISADDISIIEGNWHHKLFQYIKEYANGNYGAIPAHQVTKVEEWIRKVIQTHQYHDLPPVEEIQRHINSNSLDSVRYNSASPEWIKTVDHFKKHMKRIGVNANFGTAKLSSGKEYIYVSYDKCDRTTKKMVEWSVKNSWFAVQSNPERCFYAVEESNSKITLHFNMQPLFYFFFKVPSINNSQFRCIGCKDIFDLPPKQIIKENLGRFEITHEIQEEKITCTACEPLLETIQQISEIF